MRKFILSVGVMFVATLVSPGISAAQDPFENRVKIDETQAQVAPMIYCKNSSQLDCVERVIVEHVDGTIEEARYIETKYFYFPPVNGQPVTYGDMIFEFHSDSLSGTTKRMKVATHVQTPLYKNDGKAFGIYWLMLGRVEKPGEDISTRNNCDGINPTTCLNYKGLETEDRFNVYFRTSWLKPVAAGGEGINANLEYQFLSNGMRWKFSGVEFLQPVFKDGSLLSKSSTPEGADLRPDALNPTLYAVLDHAGIDREHSLWDPTCADTGFTVTINNAPMAGQLFWNYGTESLTFNIYAPHLSVTGATNKGYFYARIPSAWLNCRFPGNTLSTATKVQVQVLNEDGTTQVATTKTGIQDGQISIEAAGFHFSSPKIVAKKLMEDGTTVAAKTPLIKDYWHDKLIQKLEAPISPSTLIINASTTKARTITCIKGKLSKKVTGLKPTCPEGYKKK